MENEVFEKFYGNWIYSPKVEVNFIEHILYNIKMFIKVKAFIKFHGESFTAREREEFYKLEMFKLLTFVICHSFVI